MPKPAFIEANVDQALLSSGRALVVTDYSQSNQRIEVVSTSPKYKVEFVSTIMDESEELPKEIVKLRITPNESMSETEFYNSITADFSTGVKTNHFFKLPSMVDLASTKTESYSASKSQASYSFETIFNYVSEEYDRIQVGIDEVNLGGPLGFPSMDDFLNANSNVINFGVGNQMRNFVVDQGVQRATDQSPYYNHLRINQRIDNGISNFAIKLGIFDDLLQDYLLSDPESDFFHVQSDKIVDKNTYVRLYNLNNFLTTDRELDQDNFFTLSDSVRPSGMSLAFRKHLLKGFLKDSSQIMERSGNQISKPGFRKFEDIYNNKEAHKEIFCYSVAKYDENVLDSTLIQTIYSPALRESTPIVDTQIKYGKNYAYKVVGHYMVIGNRYEYKVDSINASILGEQSAEITVTNRANGVIVPFDILTKNINVVQMPPVYPQVSFKTKNDSSKSISIYLSPTKTEIKEPFIVVTKKDEDQLLDLYRLPNGRDLNGNFRFKTYGDQGLYEVFRLSDPPRSYSDFKDAKIGEISMPFNTTDAIFKDVVIPNKKYYYMFRSINQKGMVSNPSMVYECTLLIDADESKITTDTYHFPKPRDKESALGFRKLFRITPAVEHILFDQSQAALFQRDSLVGTLDDLKLGIAPKAVWGRKFKIRIKSKTSGKMLDIILNVDLTKNKTEEEF